MLLAGLFAVCLCIGVVFWFCGLYLFAYACVLLICVLVDFGYFRCFWLLLLWWFVTVMRFV